MSVYDHQISTSSSILTVPTPITLHQAPDDLACHNIPSVLDRRGGPSDSMRPVASRKRSRDEAAINLNDDEPLVPTPIETIQESEEDWIYGEGMVLIKPGSGYVADASSQSGTWVEEKAAEEVARRNAEAAAKAQAQMYSERPILRSHKSQRLEQGNQGSDALSNFSTPLSAPSDISAMLTPAGSDTPCPPVIDDFTLHLGIGWRRISDDDHIQAAARGWARYIENHYPLSGVLIRLESKGLQSYLVESAEGFYLFSEDLKQGRLVSKTAQGALVNLGTSPPAFEGSGTIIAAESPKPLEVPLEAAELYRTDFEMDMS